MSKIINFQNWLDLNPHTAENKQLFLTEEQVRSFPQFKDASREEVENIITVLHNLSLISYELFCQETLQSGDLQIAA